MTPEQIDAMLSSLNHIDARLGEIAMSLQRIVHLVADYEDIKTGSGTIIGALDSIQARLVSLEFRTTDGSK